MRTDTLHRLECGIQQYDWGQRGQPGQPPFIAQLLGRPFDGKPYAEMWIGDHPALPAVLADLPGRPSLPAALVAAPEPLLGWDAPPSLPFLLKVLSCERPLSIQAHPDRRLAARLHREDPAHYPDANHKPEIVVALTPFRALAGFRPAAEIRRDLARIGILDRLFGGMASGPDWLRRAYAHLFSAPDAAVTAALAAALDAVSTGKAHDDVFGWCAALHPGDRGAIATYFLNLVDLEPGGALFLGPNEPHAYLQGSAIECMAASDNVVRAGLTAKHIDREVLLAMLSYREGPPAIIPGEVPEPGVRRYTAPVDEFVLSLHGLGNESRELRGNGMVSLLLVLEGSVLFMAGREEIPAGRGTVWVWPAAAGSITVRCSGPAATVVQATPAQRPGPTA